MVSPPPPPLHSPLPPPPYMILGWFNLQLARLTSSPHTKSILKTWPPSCLVHIRLLHPSPPRPPLTLSHPPPCRLMRRWELLTWSTLPVLFFCLIGVLLVTINSFLSRLQAALICCHRQKSNVHFCSHNAGSHRLECQPGIFYVTYFFYSEFSQFLRIYRSQWLTA